MLFSDRQTKLLFFYSKIITMMINISILQMIRSIWFTKPDISEQLKFPSKQFGSRKYREYVHNIKYSTPKKFQSAQVEIDRGNPNWTGGVWIMRDLFIDSDHSIEILRIVHPLFNQKLKVQIMDTKKKSKCFIYICSALLCTHPINKHNYLKGWPGSIVP